MAQFVSADFSVYKCLGFMKDLERMTPENWDFQYYPRTGSAEKCSLLIQE